MLSTDWIYENVFKLNDNEIEQERIRIVADLKRKWRYDQIEQDGEDPAFKVKTDDDFENFDNTNERRNL